MTDVQREKGSSRPMILRPGKKRAEPYLRASEVSKLAVDSYGLNIWQQDRIGAVVARDEKIRQEWLAVDPEEKGEAFWKRKALREKTIRAWTAGKSYNRGAGVAGTKFHAVTDHHDSDTLFDVSDEFADDLAVYQNVLSQVGTVLATEAFVVNHELGIGGSLDKLIQSDLLTPDGEVAGVVVADLKTGKVDKKELEFGMQMAVYANSYPYDPSRPTGYSDSWFVVNRKWGMVIHLPLGSNSANVIWVDIGAAWEIVKAVITIKETRNITTVKALTIGGPTIEDKIRNAPTKRALALIYQDHKHEWTTELKALAEARRAAIG